MKKKVYAALCILWMIVMFLFSAQNAQQSSGMSDGVLVFIEQLLGLDLLHGSSFLAETAQFFIRKAAHMGEYAVLAMLLYAYMRQTKLSHPLLMALAGAVLYACSDEIHQLFVPGRSGQLRDVGIDALGALLGLLFQQLLLYIGGCLKEKCKKKKKISENG